MATESERKSKGTIANQDNSGKVGEGDGATAGEVLSPTATV